MLQSIRLAFRSLFKTPGFTAVAIITIALAIGANTAVFSLVNALLIRPLPFKAPQNLILLFEKFSGQGLDQIPVSVPEYLDWEKQTRSYERIAAFNFADFNLTGGDMPERIQGAVVTPSLFPLLGVPPIKGRIFNDTEFGEGNDGVVVISERLWRRRFNSNPQLLGTQRSVNGRSFAVIGGMRPALMILLGAVAMVLLIACANLTPMLLARAGAREREFAIRLALGAGRTQLVRQMLSESILLALVGGSAGVILAIWGLD